MCVCRYNSYIDSSPSTRSRACSNYDNSSAIIASAASARAGAHASNKRRRITEVNVCCVYWRDVDVNIHALATHHRCDAHRNYDTQTNCCGCRQSAAQATEYTRAAYERTHVWQLTLQTPRTAHTRTHTHAQISALGTRRRHTCIIHSMLIACDKW